jgi:HTH-type transcriptional regulator/antitoxin HigA
MRPETNLPMIWKLHDMFGIPAESLIKPVKPAF